MKKVSIVIVTYNSERDIFDCVRSIRQHADIPLEEIEILVVDNNSKQPGPMFQKLREIWGEDIVLIRNTKNGGYGQGNNVGIRASHAPVVLIMNPDVRLYQPILKTAIDTFCRKPRLGMLGMTQMFSGQQNSHNSFQPSLMVNGYLIGIMQILCNRFGIYLPSYMFLQGSCFFLRKDMFQTIGMFDESNFMYGEEDDIHYRMLKTYGPESMAFDGKLHYIHLAEARESTLDYMKKLIDVNVSLFEKKGVSAQLIVRHYLQNVRLLLLRSAICGKDEKQLQLLRGMKEYLISLRQKA